MDNTGNTKETRESVSRRVAVKDKGRCQRWQGEGIPVYLGYRSDAEVCGAVAAHLGVIEHDDTSCSRCMQFELAKRLVEAVMSDNAGRLNIQAHGSTACEPIIVGQ